MSNLKVLYISSEIDPFLATSNVATYLRKLPQHMQEQGMEVRILVPRFGVINERKNRLHEVVRLSGINISVGDDEKPLTIKVASIPAAKLQVYFIDNEDYFQRKGVFADKKGNIYEDNEERTLFFCKGALETVKKLGWAPDVVHCHGWMSSLVPLFLKTTHKNDPIFKESKSIYTSYTEELDQVFSDDLPNKLKMLDITEEMTEPLVGADIHKLAAMGREWADLTTYAEGETNGSDMLIPASDEYTEQYQNLYMELTGKGEMVEEV
jgi:starch synthase